MSKKEIFNNIETTFLDYPDNSNIAIIYYMTGCEHFCKNCHNPQLQKIIKYSNNDINNIINNIIIFCKRNNTNKIVLSGGDPLHKSNINLTNKIIDKCKYNYDICIYTGFDIEYVKKNLYTGFKFVKCGKYLEQFKQLSEKNNEYIQLASTNQNFYNSHYIQISQNGKLFF